MGFNNVWFGSCGLGGSASAIIGMSYSRVKLWKTEGGGGIPIHAQIFGKRLGVMAAVDVAHAVCIAYNLPGPDFESIASTGWDFALSAGGKADSAIKAGGKLAKAAKMGANELADWATTTSAQMAVNEYLGNIDFNPTGPAFILIPTVAGVGVGVGVWYEWQTLTKYDPHVAYQHIPPHWRVVKVGSNIRVEIENIPEYDGTELMISFMTKSNGSNQPVFLKRQGHGSGYLIPITVQKGVAYGEDGLKGILMQNAKIDSLCKDDGYFRTARIPVRAKPGEQFHFGIGISLEHNVYRWESTQTAMFQTNYGRQSQIHNASISNGWLK